MRGERQNQGDGGRPIRGRSLAPRNQRGFCRDTFLVACRAYRIVTSHPREEGGVLRVLPDFAAVRESLAAQQPTNRLGVPGIGRLGRGPAASGQVEIELEVVRVEVGSLRRLLCGPLRTFFRHLAGIFEKIGTLHH